MGKKEWDFDKDLCNVERKWLISVACDCSFVKDWLHHIGIGDQTSVVHDNDEPDDGTILVHNESIKKRSVPTRAALSLIKPSIGRSTISEKAKVAMQNYLNHFLGSIDIVNSREVTSKPEPKQYTKSEPFYRLVRAAHVSRFEADIVATYSVKSPT